MKIIKTGRSSFTQKVIESFVRLLMERKAETSLFTLFYLMSYILGHLGFHMHKSLKCSEGPPQLEVYSLKSGEAEGKSLTTYVNTERACSPGGPTPTTALTTLCPQSLERRPYW